MTIKEARKTVGLTQQQLSDWLEIPKRTIEDWDMGKGFGSKQKWLKDILVEKILFYPENKKIPYFEITITNKISDYNTADEFIEYAGFNYKKALEIYESQTDWLEKKQMLEAKIYLIPVEIVNSIEDFVEFEEIIGDDDAYENITDYISEKGIGYNEIMPTINPLGNFHKLD